MTPCGRSTTQEGPRVPDHSAPSTDSEAWPPPGWSPGPWVSATPARRQHTAAGAPCRRLTPSPLLRQPPPCCLQGGLCPLPTLGPAGRPGSEDALPSCWDRRAGPWPLRCLKRRPPGAPCCLPLPCLFHNSYLRLCAGAGPAHPLQDCCHPTPTCKDPGSPAAGETRTHRNVDDGKRHSCRTHTWMPQAHFIHWVGRYLNPGAALSRLKDLKFLARKLSSCPGSCVPPPWHW